VERRQEGNVQLTEVTTKSTIKATLSVPDERPRVLLALDTSTDRATVVLYTTAKGCVIAPQGESRKHGRGLIGTIRDVLRQAGCVPQDLSAIGVGLGPGSFTGLRIGVTAAKTLAYVVGCPVYGFDSLEAIAGNVANRAGRVVVIADAQRGDLFVADFQRDQADGPLLRNGNTRLERVDAWPGTLDAGTIVIGPNLGKAEPTWPAGVERIEGEPTYPQGEALIALLKTQIAAGIAAETWLLEPSYVRRSAAEEKAWPVGGPTMINPPIQVEDHR
jgi:tRNA threonylcarbamoyladenosine biosynthesis protein TsaB